MLQPGLKRFQFSPRRFEVSGEAIQPALQSLALFRGRPRKVLAGSEDQFFLAADFLQQLDDALLAFLNALEYRVRVPCWLPSFDERRAGGRKSRGASSRLRRPAQSLGGSAQVTRSAAGAFRAEAGDFERRPWRATVGSRRRSTDGPNLLLTRRRKLVNSRAVQPLHALD